MRYLLPVLKALNEAGADYIVVGGVAVVLRGHARLTVDLDLVIDLAPENATKVVEVLKSLGLGSRVPEDPRLIADELARQRWREKGMTVFSMSDPSNPLVAVDLFIDYPLPFDELKRHADPIDLAGLQVPTASIVDLLKMKRSTGRANDLQDVKALEELQKRD